ncbi:MFS transporter [Actinoalloteichus hymeniacidonis]|uniref:Arabinose efflux permease family protein n=1 Tax=Actinoalloteichus hymeniacidonis TaxID=340345 RepID=A0AAC9MXS7_9PSEU|nr:MFS transporter [Actinoalloteichus hymeniacidonis]AOS63628.1 arabinose efflux permease family protein [Actinoalloteichus hymeniacidonis]MBB5908324.1 EmrB/QacA subfamily drug resistance transporter [Actinoalloteichus hymeniacidonis]
MNGDQPERESVESAESGSHIGPATETLADRGSWPTLAVVLSGAFIALLDTTIVNVALSDIGTALGAEETALAWILSGYFLSFGLVLIPAGRLSDRFGHRRLFVAGMTLFTVASLACGLAGSPGLLVFLRVIQGLGAGLFFPVIAALIQLTYTGRARARAFGLLGAVIGISTAIGPLVGGLLVHGLGTQGWRWVFLVNVPIGVIVVPAALRLLPRPAPKYGSEARRADLVGLGLLFVSITALLLPLVEGQHAGWSGWPLVSLGLALLAGGTLWWWERRSEEREGDPILSPALLRRPALAAGALVALVYFAAFTSVFFSLALLWQEGLGHDALETGLILMPFALGNFLGGLGSARFAARLGRTALMVAAVLVGLGLSATLLMLKLGTPDPNGWTLVFPMALAGIGNGLFIAPNTNLVLSAVPPAQAGTASALLSTAQRFGSSIGIAMVSSVLFGTLRVEQSGRAQAYLHSTQLALLVNIALVLLALALVFVLPRKTDAAWS